MEDRMNKDISGIVDNLNEMNKLIDYDEQFNILMGYGLIPETPPLWYAILIKMARRVTECLRLHGFEKESIVYHQVKEKWGLRVYWGLAEALDDDLTDEMRDKVEKVQDEIGVIIDEAEEEVDEIYYLALSKAD